MRCAGRDGNVTEMAGAPMSRILVATAVPKAPTGRLRESQRQSDGTGIESRRHGVAGFVAKGAGDEKGLRRCPD